MAQSIDRPNIRPIPLAPMTKPPGADQPNDMAPTPAPGSNLMMPRCFPLPSPGPSPNVVDAATFEMMDGDGSGTLSQDEWKRAGWSADRMKSFDANGDGQVSQDEFMASRGYEREFNRKDTNHDGSLDRQELTGWQILYAKAGGALGGGAAETPASASNMIRRPGPMEPIDPTLPAPVDRFATFDRNGDGKISRDEFIQGRREESQGPVVEPPTWPIQPPMWPAQPPIWLNDSQVRPYQNPGFRPNDIGAVVDPASNATTDASQPDETKVGKRTWQA